MTHHHPERECDHSEATHEAVAREVREALPTEGELNATAELFKAFADLTRIRILSALAIRETCVSELAEALEMTQSAISHQLRGLRNAKLIRSRRDGKTVYYSLADAHVVSILACATDHIREE